MENSGEIMNLEGIGKITADKHSTGGIGDKTTLIIAPMVAVCGVAMPKMSGRGLGFTGGTIDKLESIPGFSVSLPFEKFIENIKKSGFAIVSQSGNLVPADKKLYALRDVTDTVDSMPLICSSVMSKKLAMNTDCILLDVKCGSGAFMKTEKEAGELAELMVKVGKGAGKKCRAVITDMNMPLGMNIGNSLEVIEAVEVLKGNVKGRLREICVILTANILEMCGKGSYDECIKLAEESIDSGKALEKFRQEITLQGGNPEVTDNYSLFPQPKHKIEIFAWKSGYIAGMASEKIGEVSLFLGAGRETKDSAIDYSAGIILNKTVGEYIEKGELLMTLHTSLEDTSDAQRKIKEAIMISEYKTVKTPVIKAIIN
jgi:pyrimidine-nucleoside phosphorylase